MDAIVEAAGQLLVTQGRAAVTTNAVAAHAGVSIGSLYQYFPNKEAIFGALQDKHRDQVMPLIQHVLANLAADPNVDMVEGVLALMRAMVEIHKEAPDRMRALAEELHEDHSVVDIASFANAVAEILAGRSGRPASKLRARAWLACMTITQVGRALVHQPPPLDLEVILTDLGHMLRGLFGAPPATAESSLIPKPACSL